jgi:hypothetical protein
VIFLFDKKTVIISMEIIVNNPDIPEEETMKANVMTAKRYLILSVPIFMLFIWACTPQVVLRPNIPILDTHAVETAMAPLVGQDAHFLTATDFFFMEEPLPNSSSWDLVFLGKVIQAPSIQTDNQAQMLRVQDGSTVWARWLATTRIATAADISLGKTVIFYDGEWGEGDVRIPPKSNQDARSLAWIISRITDTSETFRGYVLCGGDMKVSLKNLRVIVTQ